MLQLTNSHLWFWFCPEIYKISMNIDLVSASELKNKYLVQLFLNNKIKKINHLVKILFVNIWSHPKAAFK